MVSSINNECPVCLENYGVEKHKPVVTNCGHTFCKECADKVFQGTWMDYVWKSDKLCPMCRQNVTEYKDLPAPQKELADSVDSLSSSFVNLGTNSISQPEFRPTLEKYDKIYDPEPKTLLTEKKATTAPTAKKKVTSTKKTAKAATPKKQSKASQGRSIWCRNR